MGDKTIQLLETMVNQGLYDANLVIYDMRTGEIIPCGLIGIKKHTGGSEN